jgi:hypothetical protein
MLNLVVRKEKVNVHSSKVCTAPFVINLIGLSRIGHIVGCQCVTFTVMDTAVEHKPLNSFGYSIVGLIL